MARELIHVLALVAGDQRARWHFRQKGQDAVAHPAARYRLRHLQDYATVKALGGDAVIARRGDEDVPRVITHQADYSTRPRRRRVVAAPRGAQQDVRAQLDPAAAGQVIAYQRLVGRLGIAARRQQRPPHRRRLRRQVADQDVVLLRAAIDLGANVPAPRHHRQHVRHRGQADLAAGGQYGGPLGIVGIRAQPHGDAGALSAPLRFDPAWPGDEPLQADGQRRDRYGGQQQRRRSQQPPRPRRPRPLLRQRFPHVACRFGAPDRGACDRGVVSVPETAAARAGPSDRVVRPVSRSGRFAPSRSPESISSAAW